MSDLEDATQIAQETHAPSMPPSKLSPATAETSKTDNVELASLQNGDIKLPLHEDIMQLARLGEIVPIEKLIQEGKYTANYKDHEGITPLHVRYSEPLCRATLAAILIHIQRPVGRHQQPLRPLQIPPRRRRRRQRSRR